MSEVQIAQGFAEAVTAIVYIERNSLYGQMAREIVVAASYYLVRQLPLSRFHR